MKTNEIINETKLARVIQHFTSDEKVVAIISAFRGEYTYSENVIRNKQLASEIKQNGYGYVYVDGHWIEKAGNNDGAEDSILIIGNSNDNGKLKGLLRKWNVKFNQDACIYKADGTTNSSLIFQNGREESLGELHVKDIERIKSDLAKKADADGTGYTKLRNHSDKTFVFERERDELSWIGKLKKQ